MLEYLAKLVQKRPWSIISVILIITLGFSTLLPSLEMKTDMKEFMPDDELVKAEMRVMDYFGGTQQIVFLYGEKEQADSVITPEALREQYYLQRNLANIEGVNGSFGIVDLIDQICWMEYGKGFENCTDDQISTAINDVLSSKEINDLVLLEKSDSNEARDFTRYPKILRGKQADAFDVKNAHISYNDSTIIFTIEVYNLSRLDSTLKPPLPMVNVVEWYIGFNNLIMPIKEFNIRYEIAARIEPRCPIWEIGAKPLANLRMMYEQIKNRELHSYKKGVYLWMELPEQNISYPVSLHNANVTFDSSTNSVSIKVSRKELGTFGIAPQFGSFALPAKLSNFTVGTRYYASPVLKTPWYRIEVNTSFLINTIESIQEKPLLSRISNHLLNRFINIPAGEKPAKYAMPLPKSLSMKDIKTRWKNIDTAVERASHILFIKPSFFNELKTSVLGFLSKDYTVSNKPSACLIIVELDNIQDYDETIALNQKIVSYVNEFNSKHSFIYFKATGDGVISAQIHETTSEANRIIGPSIFIIIMFILFVSFRKFSYIVLPLFSLTVSVIWVFGTMVLLGIPFNTMAVAVVPLLMGLGVDYSVHLSHTYRTEVEKGKRPDEAIAIAIHDIGRAMFLAMLTTVIAFLSFLTASVPPVRNFGIILAFGIFYTFINAITLQASIRYVLDRNRKISSSKITRSISLRKSMEKVSRTVLTHRRVVLAVMLVLSMIMGLSALHIRTGFDYKSFLPSNNPAMQIFNEISEKFPYASQDQEYVLIEGNVATVKILEGLMKTQENLYDDTFVAHRADGSVKAYSIYTLIEQVVSANDTLVEKYNMNNRTFIPQTDGDVRRLFDYLYSSSEYSMQTRTFLYKNGSKYEATVLQIYADPSISVDSNADLNKKIETFRDELKNDLPDFGDADVTITGPLIVTLSITSSMTESQIISTILSFILAAIVLALSYRNPVLGIVAVIPVGVSIIWILGTMCFIGYTLNVLTITVTSLTIGMGIDYAIHATERFRLIADRTGDVNKAVYETISHTGGALLISATTTAAGFGILIFAPMPPQVQFGVITAMTIIYAFTMSILLLPLILIKWGEWRKKRRGYIISDNKA